MGGWFISGEQVSFSSNLVGRIFVSPLNALQDIFFLTSLLCRIFFPQKNVVYIYRMYLYLHCVYCSNSSNMQLQKMDDVFSLWDVNRKDIDLFIEQANTFHPTMKFTAEILEKEITFLDTVV